MSTDWTDPATRAEFRSEAAKRTRPFRIDPGDLVALLDTLDAAETQRLEARRIAEEYAPAGSLPWVTVADVAASISAAVTARILAGSHPDRHMEGPR